MSLKATIFRNSYIFNWDWNCDYAWARECYPGNCKNFNTVSDWVDQVADNKIQEAECWIGSLTKKRIWKCEDKEEAGGDDDEQLTYFEGCQDRVHFSQVKVAEYWEPFGTKIKKAFDRDNGSIKNEKENEELKLTDAGWLGVQEAGSSGAKVKRCDRLKCQDAHMAELAMKTAALKNAFSGTNTVSDSSLLPTTK